MPAAQKRRLLCNHRLVSHLQIEERNQHKIKTEKEGHNLFGIGEKRGEKMHNNCEV